AGGASAMRWMVLKRAVAVLYADSGAQPESSLNAEATESLTRIAGRTIELMLTRRGAEQARPSAQTAGAAEIPPGTPLRTGGKAMGAAIQQTPSQLTIQPAAQMDSAWVGSELKQDYAREIQHEIHEDAPQIAKTDGTTDRAPDEITVETRLTREIPLISFKDSQVDESLRQAEAQWPEPAYIETEPGATSGRLPGLREISETSAGISGRLRFESPASQPPPSPPEREEQPAFSETIGEASPMP